MMSSRLFYLQALILALTAFLYLHFGLGERFFWRFWWWDIPMHILGGLWVGLATAWLLGFLGFRLSFVQIVLASFVVGVSWEMFEYVLDIGGSAFMSYQLDSIKDVFDDIVGGALAGWIVRYFDGR